MAAVGDGAMELDDIAVVNIRDLASAPMWRRMCPSITPSSCRDCSDFARQMLALVALGQVQHGGRLAPLAPVAGRIFATVDPLPDIPWPLHVPP